MDTFLLAEWESQAVKTLVRLQGINLPDGLEVSNIVTLGFTLLAY